MALTYLKKKQARYSDSVIILHGLGRTYLSMLKMESALKEEGYRVINLSYPSRKKNIAQLADETISRGIEESHQHQSNTIHFVTHSMGGILLRDYLSKHEIQHLGHTVMLSPPNKGSELVDRLRNNFFFKWVLGPAGNELGTDKSSTPKNLQKVDFSVGIITGNKNTVFDGYFANMISGDNDGKVSVESARVNGMVDFLVTPNNHTLIMNDSAVIKQTLHFLRKGRFKR